ncbi:hypothetical protein [Mycobacterium riyadhense]|nr:hypothetical protein [Mycobacterium riyadhense]
MPIRSPADGPVVNINAAPGEAWLVKTANMGHGSHVGDVPMVFG